VSPSHTELENKSHFTEAITYPSAPNRALQAFQLLSESPEAQVTLLYYCIKSFIIFLSFGENISWKPYIDH